MENLTRLSIIPLGSNSELGNFVARFWQYVLFMNTCICMLFRIYTLSIHTYIYIYIHICIYIYIFNLIQFFSQGQNLRNFLPHCYHIHPSLYFEFINFDISNIGASRRPLLQRFRYSVPASLLLSFRDTWCMVSGACTYS